MDSKRQPTAALISRSFRLWKFRFRRPGLSRTSATRTSTDGQDPTRCSLPSAHSKNATTLRLECFGYPRRASVCASLLLTTEALFTALLAWLLYRESMDRRVWTAMALLTVGGAVLVIDQGRDDGAGLAGLMAILIATAAWGIDNSLSRALADRDPGQVVMAKAAFGATATGLLAWIFGDPLPGLPATLGLLAVGATGYGLSLRFYLLAQRAFGASRTGSVFAFAPFIGAGLALATGDRAGTWLMAAGGLLMLAGVVLHLAESHSHEHAHDAIEHEHAHSHDDGHHEHRHDPMPAGPHSHRHRHDEIRHAHPHAPDLHHTHVH